MTKENKEIAFKKFQEINSLSDLVDKCRTWLLDYEGLHFSIGKDKQDMVKWKEDKDKLVYSDKLWNGWIYDGFYKKEDGTYLKKYIYAKDINKIQRHKRRLVIEFDDKDLSKIPEHVEEVKNKLKKLGYGFIVSTHNGKSVYIWVEFTRDLTSDEAKSFLIWIAPKGSEIDLNFASDNFRFPVLFALHWKYGTIEEPIEYVEGEPIDYDGLKIKSKKIKSKIVDGYETYDKEKESIFDFEYYNPQKNIETLEELKEIIIRNFPSIWFETKACLSVCATLSLKNLNGCPSLNLVGNPSGEKTTVLSFFYGQDMTYISDDFTPRAFVSHSANVSEEDLAEVDLLPRIKNKILITPELAPLFEAPKDRIIDNFAMLTRVLDGEGLNRDSGTHGHRGYSGDYKFIWLGATTPLRASVWGVMGKIGNRLFFLNMKDKNRTDNDYLDMFKGKAYEEKVKECRGAVRSFLDGLYKKNKIREIQWNAEDDIFLLPEIIKYAKFLSKLRASLMTWKAEEKGDYEYNFPIIEEPPRAINSLYNLAKGHALINGRTFLKKEDIEIVKAVCFSSMPHDRSEFLKLLAKHEGKLTTQQIERELNCSTATATRTMKIFEVLGVVKIKSIDVDYGGAGRPMHYIEINLDFAELLEHTQQLNNEINNKFSENTAVCDSYETVNPQDFVKTQQKNIDTQQLNNEINNKFSENTAV